MKTGETNPHGPDGPCTCHETCPACDGDRYVVGRAPGHSCRWCGSGCCDVPLTCSECEGTGIVPAEPEADPLADYKLWQSGVGPEATFEEWQASRVQS